MAVEDARDYFGLDVRHRRRRRSSPASRMREQTTGFVGAAQQGRGRRQRLRACVRASTRTACCKARDTYEIMRAEDVGWAANKIVLGKLSGRNAFKQRLQELGIELESEAEINAAFAALQGTGRPQERAIFDEDIVALVGDGQRRRRRATVLPPAIAERSARRRASGRTRRWPSPVSRGRPCRGERRQRARSRPRSASAIESVAQDWRRTAALFGQCDHVRAAQNPRAK
jgi:2-isopropylmalate synthase